MKKDDDDKDSQDRIEIVREAKLLKGIIKVSVRHGDILDERCDAIVNPSNQIMQHTEGLSKLLAHEGGAIIQQDSDVMLSKFFPSGMVPPGKCIRTTAGNLPFKHIIHTVGPIYADGGEQKIA